MSLVNISLISKKWAWKKARGQFVITVEKKSESLYFNGFLTLILVKYSKRQKY